MFSIIRSWVEICNEVIRYSLYYYVFVINKIKDVVGFDIVFVVEIRVFLRLMKLWIFNRKRDRFVILWGRRKDKENLFFIIILSLVVKMCFFCLDKENLFNIVIFKVKLCFSLNWDFSILDFIFEIFLKSKILGFFLRVYTSNGFSKLNFIVVKEEVRILIIKIFWFWLICVEIRFENIFFRKFLMICSILFLLGFLG